MKKSNQLDYLLEQNSHPVEEDMEENESFDLVLGIQTPGKLLVPIEGSFKFLLPPQ